MNKEKLIYILPLALIATPLILLSFRKEENALQSVTSEPKEEVVNNSATTGEKKMLKKYTEAPKMSLDQSKIYKAVLKTEMGDIKVALNAKETPITVNNFVFLAKEGFYNETIFHRTIANFMIQGGDPTGTGSGGPGYKFADEDFLGDYTRGTMAMANAGANTNGSQFFIMHQDGALPKNYVIFGKVEEGLEVLDKIASAPVTANMFGEKSKPVTPVKIYTVEIVEE